MHSEPAQLSCGCCLLFDIMRKELYCELPSQVYTIVGYLQCCAADVEYSVYEYLTAYNLLLCTAFICDLHAIRFVVVSHFLLYGSFRLVIAASRFWLPNDSVGLYTNTYAWLRMNGHHNSMIVYWCSKQRKGTNVLTLREYLKDRNSTKRFLLDIRKSIFSPESV